MSDFDIAAGGYPLDVQTLTPHDTGFVYGKPDIYGVRPCVNVPIGLDGLWVVGKAAGYDPIAASSARVVPFGMAVGEAIGVAAAMSVKDRIQAREFVTSPRLVSALRKELIARGAYLPEVKTRQPVGPYDEPYYGDFRIMLARGLAVGGYGNAPNLDDEVKSLSYVYLLSNVGERFLGDSALGKRLVTRYGYSATNEPLDPDMALMITQDAACQLGVCLEKSWDALKAYGLAPDEFPPEGNLTRGEMYALASRLATLELTLVERTLPEDFLEQNSALAESAKGRATAPETD